MTAKLSILGVVVLGVLVLSSPYILSSFSSEEYLRDTESEVATVSEATPKPLSKDLLPDLIPLPPSDITLERQENGDVYLRFGTTYLNQGEGPLEFIADPATANVAGDIERDVFQRIYRREGGHRDSLSGTFEWHNEHLHYHFTDFVTYELRPVSLPDDETALPPVAEAKSTFCVRDVSRVTSEVSGVVPEADYTICGKERQGISVGWGDTYFADYPDQHLDVTGFPSGIYRLSFFLNPESRFEEVTRDNNFASALIRLDMETRDVVVRATDPSSYPEIEHVHLEQPFGL